MERLGKNHGGYRGETIDIRAVLREIETAAQQHGWTSERFGRQGEFDLSALHRSPVRTSLPAPRIYLSAGIHGDEPAGPLAALQLIQENRWPANLEFYFVAVFESNRLYLEPPRERRRHGSEPRLSESQIRRGPRAHRLAGAPARVRLVSLSSRRLGVARLLSLRTESRQPAVAGGKIIEAVQKVCPIDRSEIIEDRPAKGGIIRPNLDPRTRPQWAEAFYLIMHKSRQGYTLEAPSDFPLSTRVNALVAGVSAALESFNPA